MAAKYRKKDGIVDRNIAGESFLIPVCGQPSDMENIFVLNPLADFIWQRLDGRHTLAAILKAIVENFDVEAGRARGDMSDLISRLLENGLIEAAA